MSAKHTIPGPRGPEKDPAWFSWRHATNAEHVAAREAWLSLHGPEARRRRAAERQEAFGQEVQVCARDHNITEPEARRVVNSTHWMDYHKAQRKAGAR